ncbi:hypothetical protein TcCL_Unassigned04004 [Trypanosoma cruzi]|nr:hypothetical protein TcCL_Unassigned04004 [Trypanosoma cruzi]
MRRTSGSTHAPGEEEKRYDDVRARREPAVETAGHLASQVFRLRREAHQPRLPTAGKQTRECVAARLALPTRQSTSGQRGLSSRQRRRREGDPSQGGVVPCRRRHRSPFRPLN